MGERPLNAWFGSRGDTMSAGPLYGYDEAADPTGLFTRYNAPEGYPLADGRLGPALLARRLPDASEWRRHHYAG
jgi:hypothetical protein